MQALRGVKASSKVKRSVSIRVERLRPDLRPAFIEIMEDGIEEGLSNSEATAKAKASIIEIHGEAAYSCEEIEDASSGNWIQRLIVTLKTHRNNWRALYNERRYQNEVQRRRNRPA